MRARELNTIDSGIIIGRSPIARTVITGTWFVYDLFLRLRCSPPQVNGLTNTKLSLHTPEPGKDVDCKYRDAGPCSHEDG